MSFTESWVESEPDGSIITVSLLDDSDRLIKRAVRERLEGDPANPNSGIYESGTFGNTAIVRAGTARAYVVTEASLGTLTKQDGRMAFTSDTNKLFHLKASGNVEIAYVNINGARAMTGNLAMGGNKVTGLGAAAANGDAVRWEQAAVINQTRTISGAWSFDRGAAVAPFIVSQVNAAVVTNLDADKLDGQHASAFATAGHNHDSTYYKIAGGNINGLVSIVNTGLPQLMLDYSATRRGRFQIDDNGLFITCNAKYTGSWTRDDDTKGSFIISLHTGSNQLQFRTAPAGSGTVVHTIAMYFNDSGVANFNNTPLVGGTAVSLVGHTHDASAVNTGILPVARGGTGLGAYTANRLLYSSGAGTLANLAAGTAVQTLQGDLTWGGNVSYGMALTTAFVTTSDIPANTGLKVTAAPANSVWALQFACDMDTATSGTKVTIGNPAGSTVRFRAVYTDSTVSAVSGLSNTQQLPSGNRLNTPLLMFIYVAIGSTAGDIDIQLSSNTAGQGSTIRLGATLQATRIS